MVLFMQQVEDLETSAASGRTSEILLNYVDDRLTIPIKRQGIVKMYNGLDILQS